MKTQSESVVYRVLVPSFLWRGKRHTGGELLTVNPHTNETARKQEKRKLETHLAQGSIRVATADDLARASEPEAAAPLEAKPDTAGTEAQEPTPETDEGVFAWLKVRDIAPSPVNPRREFAKGPMQELTDSVREKGVRVAINVRRMPDGHWFTEPGRQGGKDGWFLLDRRRFRDRKGTDGLVSRLYEHIPGELFEDFFPTEAEAKAAAPTWEIIAGERRWRAALYAKRETIRAVVEVMDDIEAAELQVVENDQREDLSPIESAAGYDYLLHQPSYDIKKLITKTGKSKSVIYDRLKLLELPKSAQDAVASGRLPMTTAQLIGAADEGIREEAAQIILGLMHPWGHPMNNGHGADAPVETFREAERTIERLKREKTKKENYEAAAAELSRKGIRVLAKKEAEKVISYGTRLADGGGHVGAKDICPRDPEGRTWEKVLKGAPGVERRAVVAQEYDGQTKGIIVFDRDQANAALKNLGLWDAEGSQAAKEKLEKQKQKAKEQREKAAVHEDLDAIVAKAKAAETVQLRAVLAAALGTMCRHDTEAIRLVCVRRQWETGAKGFGAHSVLVRGHGERMPLGELAGLVAELSALAIGGSWDHWKEGRQTLKTLLKIEAGEKAEAESPDVRTEEVGELAEA